MESLDVSRVLEKSSVLEDTGGLALLGGIEGRIDVGDAGKVLELLLCSDVAEDDCDSRGNVLFAEKLWEEEDVMSKGEDMLCCDDVLCEVKDVLKGDEDTKELFERFRL